MRHISSFAIHVNNCSMLIIGSRIQNGHTSRKRILAAMPPIFINFRNGDDPFAAALLYQTLVDRMGEDSVFRSSDSLALGRAFEAELLNAVRGCRVLIAVIGRHWLKLGDGTPRQALW